MQNLDTFDLQHACVNTLRHRIGMARIAQPRVVVEQAHQVG
jgi:hypothetical protein